MNTLIRILILILLSALLVSCLSVKTTLSENGNDTYQYVLQGSGKYTIILESGLGDGMKTWDPIFNKLSKLTRTFAYNRSGYGKAKMNRDGKDAFSVATNLYKLLKSENIEGPYILIGHSLGGQYTMAFSKLYPEKVVGNILLDTRHPKFTTWCKERNAGNCEIPKIMYSLLPQRTKREYDDSMRYNESQLEDLSALESIPLTVITRTMERGMESQGFKNLWIETQKDLITLSDRGSYHEISNSGHYVHKDRPNKVLEIIELTIDQL